MAKMNIFLCCLSLFLCLVVCSGSEQSKWAEKQADKTWRVAKGKTWCVAKISAPNYKLQRFLDECCSHLDCGPIKPGGPCYEPNTYQNHGSYALDLWFRVRGECRSDIGTPAVTDPSWGPCKYP